MMGIGEFKKVIDTPWKGKEVSYYVEAKYEPYAKPENFDNVDVICACLRSWDVEASGRAGGHG